MWFQTRRVFVSHSSDDDGLVDKIVKQLAARGLKPFVDHHPKMGIVPGEEWLAVLRHDLKRAQAVLVVVSESWRRSPWCQAEYRTAKLLNKAIIPVVIGPAAHDDIEPTLQRVVLEQDALDVSPDVLDAIARALPGRVLANTLLTTGFAAALLTVGMGVDKTPYGLWDAIPLKGGAFVDLVPNPPQPEGILALAVNALGRRGLYSSDNCGSTWSEFELPDELHDANRLDATANEILVSSDQGLWSFNKAAKAWSHLDLDGLSKTILVAKVVPDQPDRVIYGTQGPGGVSVGAAAMAATKGGLLRAENGSGGTSVFDRRSHKISSFPFQMNDVAFDPQDPNKIAIAAADDGVFVSLDGLATITKVAKLDLNNPFFVWFDSTGQTVFVGGRGGLSSFRFPLSRAEEPDVHRDLKMEAGEVHGLAIAADGRMMLATTTGLLAAENSHVAFQPFTPAPLERHINKVLPCGGRTLLATGGAGILSLSQGVPYWRPVLTSSSNFTAYAGIATGSLQIVSAGPYIFRSLDGGHSFESIFAPDAIVTVLSSSAAVQRSTSTSEYALRNRSEAARLGYLYRESSIVAGLGDGRIFRKSPGSIGWVLAPIGSFAFNSPVNAIARSSTNPHVLLAAFQQQTPLLSEDDGATWRPVAGLAADQAAVAFALEDGRFLVTSYDGRLRSFDPGNNSFVTGSSSAHKPISGYAFYSPLGLSLVADVGGGVYSFDRSSLELKYIAKVPVPSATDWVDLFCCDRAGGVYLGGKSMGLLRSGDGGKRWVRVASGGLSPAMSIEGLGPGPMGRPSLYSEAGLLQASRNWKICITDADCFRWSFGTIASRASRLSSHRRRKLSTGTMARGPGQKR